MSENTGCTANKNINEVLLVIPAYNEADSIERVVDELTEKYPELDYVVVTDGSTDGTDTICGKRGYNAVNLPINLGLTGCFHNGMIYAYEHGYKYAVQFDGDGQHRPEYIASMLKKASEGYDIVLGSRFIGLENKMSGLRNLGSKLIRAAIKFKTGTDVTDPTCGLRMYDRRIIKMFAKLNYLSPEPDTIAALIKHGAKVAEVPVKVAERQAGESYLNPINAAKYMKRMLAAIMKI